MGREIGVILKALVEFMLLAVITLLPAATVYIDIVVMGHELADRSVTEDIQEILILLSALMLLYGAWRLPASRGFLVLVAGFFACMLIREFDELLNSISHGFWIYPALLIAIVSIGWAIVCRDTVLVPMAAFIGTRAYYNILFGLLVVLIFSRIFGSGNLLWTDIMGEDFHWVYRSAIQEGLELFGYIFIAYGSCRLLLQLSAAETD